VRGCPKGVFLFQIEKIVPTETLASILELPSNGSKATIYLPYYAISTSIGASSSSEIIMATL